MKKNYSKYNIWDFFYTPKGEGSGGDKKMKNDHVIKKASISTLAGIIYTGMYNYGDINSLQYIFHKSLPK